MTFTTFAQKASADDTVEAGDFVFDAVTGIGDVALSKIGFGAEGALTLVTSAVGLPVNILNTSIAITAASLPLPTGAATQATLAEIKTLLETIEDNQLPDSHNVTIDNASLPVTGTFWQATQPVSVASLPLPTGAATLAEQQSQTTELTRIAGKYVDFDTGAGTDSVVAIGLLLPGNGGAVIGGTSSNPIRIDPTGTTAQPITDNGGSITVDAAELTTIAGSVNVMDDWDESDRAKVNIIAGQAGITAGAGAVAANTPRVTHASDDPVTVATQSLATNNAVQVDDAAFTPGSGKVQPAAFLFDDDTPDSIDEGDAGIGRMSANRSQYIQIRDGASGQNERGAAVSQDFELYTINTAQYTDNVQASFTHMLIGARRSSGDTRALEMTDARELKVCAAAGAANIAKAEDAASANADVGVPAMAVRKATPANTSGTDGDYEMLQMSAGRLWVDASGVSLTVIGTGTLAVQDDARATGGEDTYSFLSTAAVISAQIKGSAGTVYSMQFFNLDATPMYVRLYNQTGAPANTDTANIVWRGMIPGNTAAAGFTINFPKGKNFSTGIGIRVTAAIADNDNTALGANEVMGNVGYK